MQNTHQNRSPKRSSRARPRHGRVIDLRSLVTNRHAAEASHIVHETEKYARYVNAVLRRAFSEFLDKDTKTSTREFISDSNTSHYFSDRIHTIRERLVRITWSRQSLFWRTAYSTGVFALIALIVVVPVSVSALVKDATEVKATISSQAVLGMDSLLDAATSLQGLDFASATSQFTQAENIFNSTHNTLHTDAATLFSLARIIPFTSAAAHSGENILQLGADLSAAGQSLAVILDHITAIAKEADATQLGIVPVLQGLHVAIVESREHMYDAIEHSKGIDNSIVPEMYIEVFARMQEVLPMMYEQMGSIQNLVETILTIAGTTGEKSYLFLFQNNREMRSTGGFIGSIAIVYVNNGKITSIDVPPGGIYDIAGQLQLKVAAPEPLQLVTPYWNIQDANWFPHFPVSAEKINWFYKQITGKSVDGMFTFTPQVLESLLAITGPIDLSQEHGVIINTQNVYEELQKRAEQKYEVTQESKKIIGDLSEKMLEALTVHLSAPQDLVRIAQVLKDALTQKHILAYMTDPVTEQHLSDFDWAGELKATDRDYLAIFYTNSRGGKTDQHIDRLVTHSAQLHTQGDSIDTVEIQFDHSAEDDTKEEYENMQNITYVRVYVPLGSTLIRATGFQKIDENLYLRPEMDVPQDVDLLAIQGVVEGDPVSHVYTNTEFGKTVFGGFVQTPVGERSTVRIQYAVPLDLDVKSIDRYSLLVQKQPGNFAEKDHLKTYISYPESWKKKYETSTEYGIGTEIPMTTDQLFGIVFAQQ